MLDINLETFADTGVTLQRVVDAFHGARLVIWIDEACCFATWHGGRTVNLYSIRLENFDCFTFYEEPEDFHETKALILERVKEDFVDG